MSVEKLALHRQMARVVSAALVSIPPYVLFQAPRFGDEMRDPYTMTARYGLNPLKIIRGNLLDVRPFLELGNIRPLGRIMYSFEFVCAKGLADLLRVPLPLVPRSFARWRCGSRRIALPGYGAPSRRRDTNARQHFPAWWELWPALAPVPQSQPGVINHWPFFRSKV